MNQRFVRRAGLLASLLLLSACSSADLPSLKMPSIGGVFDSGDTVSVPATRAANPNGPLTKYAASIRVARYTDARKNSGRVIGTGGRNVIGLGSDDIVLDQDPAAVVTRVLRNTLDDAGFQMLEADDSKAIFELSGVVKELTLNVQARDQLSIAVESTLKEVATGKVVWSGLVVEKNDRYAGVSGNNREDVGLYLKQGLKTVSGKTSDAISASLMASRPELFNLTAGTKAIPGVTVYVAPTAAAPAAVSMQAAPVQPAMNAPVTSYTPRAGATNGLLLVNTNPPRAKVYLDGVYYGLSPLRLEIEPGVHAVSVKLEGYRMSSEKVSVRRGDNTEMDLALER